jgi:hypothetical protein
MGGTDSTGSFAALRMTAKNRQQQEQATARANNSKNRSRSPSGMTTKQTTAKKGNGKPMRIAGSRSPCRNCNEVGDSNFVAGSQEWKFIKGRSHAKGRMEPSRLMIGEGNSAPDGAKPLCEGVVPERLQQTRVEALPAIVGHRPGDADPSASLLWAASPY